MVPMIATTPVKHTPVHLAPELHGETASCCADPAAASLADIEIELVTDRSAFDALEVEWTALFERAGRSAQVFQSFNWNWHWANNYIDDAPGGIRGLKLSIVAGRRNGKLVMLWPLVSERVRGITQIFWIP